MKMVNPSKEHIEEHYAEHKGKPFFKGLVNYIDSGPVVAMCWEGMGVVKTGRKMMGATRPLESDPGTLRGDFAISMKRNVVHGSDSVKSA